MSIIKKALSLFLVFIMLVKTFALVSTLVSFQINRDFYAEVLCINKNKPELACKGKCILMQKLQSQIQTEKKNETDKFHFLLERALEIIVYLDSQANWKLKSPFQSFHKESINYLLSYCLYSIKGIFHPPLS